jgi:hypothetical protein
MDPSRTAELTAASRRLVRASGDLLDRARSVVQSSRDVLERVRLGQHARDEWSALWPALRDLPPSRRILAVCSVCSRARTPDGGWTPVPAAILDHLHARLDALPMSHGICPSCIQQHYGAWMEDNAPD